MSVLNLGITDAQRSATVALCDSLISNPQADGHARRLAQRLKWRVLGIEPTDEMIVNELIEPTADERVARALIVI